MRARMLSNLVRPTNLRFVFLSFVLALGPLTACGDDTEQPAGGGGSGAGGSGAGGGGEGGRAPLALTEVSLAPADGKRDDRFGADVAISGNTLLVGAPGKTTSKPDAGAAYVYVRDASGSWVEEAQLAAGTGLAYDQIGRAVDLDGDFAIVAGNGPLQGAPDSFAHNSAVIFERSGGVWAQVANLNPLTDAYTDPFENSFGAAVAISGSTAAVGAPRYALTGTGFMPGAVFVFERDAAGGWSLATKLQIPDSEVLGESVALDGSVLFVGIPGSMSVQVYERGDGGWSPTASLSGGAGFGQSVAVAGSVAIVGASSEDVGDKLGAGAAYVYERDETGAWVQVQRLVAAAPADAAYFGQGVAATPHHLMVGAPGRDRVVLYERDAQGSWVEADSFFDPEGDLGISVAADGAFAAIGAPRPEAVPALEPSSGSVLILEGLRTSD